MLALLSTVGIMVGIGMGRNISRACGQRVLKINCAFRVDAEIVVLIGCRGGGDKIDRI